MRVPDVRAPPPRSVFTCAFVPFPPPLCLLLDFRFSSFSFAKWDLVSFYLGFFSLYWTVRVTCRVFLVLLSSVLLSSDEFSGRITREPYDYLM